MPHHNLKLFVPDMNSTVASLSPERQQELDTIVARLQQGRPGSLAERIAWLDQTIDNLARHADRWVSLAWEHKRVAPGSIARAEEILAGPVVVQRFLQLLKRTCLDIQRTQQPRLPGPLTRSPSGTWQVQVFPTGGLWDPLLFPFLYAHVRLTTPGPAQAKPQLHFLPEVDRLAQASSYPGQVALVLGAGNVAAIPATDCVSKILCEGQRVLLKLNPVNAYLRPIWEAVLEPLVRANQLAIVEGGAEVGTYLTHHSAIDCVHITGSHTTHDAIVWGTSSPAARPSHPILTKPITSELGNVTPWIVIPGRYSPRQLRSQAEHLAASLVNNAAFNCLATRVIVTHRDWPQRNEFLNCVEHFLASVPPRYAYYPGAAERFTRFSGQPVTSPDGTLPWTLLRDIDPDSHPLPFTEESFVCVCVETQLAAADPIAFWRAAVDFCNERLFGTLCAAVTVPGQFPALELDRGIDALRYGTVSINQWPGTSYGLMSTPWGAYPGSTLERVQSGIGFVHNTFLLQNTQKTVVSGNLVNLTRPVWFPSHRHAEDVAWHLLRFYSDLRLSHLPPLLWHAARP